MAIKNTLLGGASQFISGINTTFSTDLNDTFDATAKLGALSVEETSSSSPSLDAKSYLLTGSSTAVTLDPTVFSTGERVRVFLGGGTLSETLINSACIWNSTAAYYNTITKSDAGSFIELTYLDTVPEISRLTTTGTWAYSLSVSAQTTNEITDVVFSSDGTKFYVMDNALDIVYQYGLTRAYDITTASYASKSIDLTTQSTLMYGLDFNAGGTSMYALGDTGNGVYQYTLSPGWDVSTASYASKSISVSSQTTSPNSIRIGDSGTKMYVNGGTTVYQYTLSTPYDVSSASYASKSYNFSSQEASLVRGFSFSPDGKRVFIVGGNRVLRQYTVGTAWDISTLTYDAAYTTDGFGSGAITGAFYSGSAILITYNNPNTVYQFRLGPSPSSKTFIVSGLTGAVTLT